MYKIALITLLTALTLISYGQNFVDVQKLVASDRGHTTGYDSSAFLGASIAIEDGVLAVGAHKEDKDANGANPLAYAGAVYIYKQNASGQWVESQKIVPPIRQMEYFGARVLFCQGYLIISAEDNGLDENNANPLYSSGAVYSYKQNSSGAWVFHQKLVASNRNAPQLQSVSFGQSLSANTTTIFIGSEAGYDANGQNFVYESGCVYAFQLNGQGQWIETQIVVPNTRYQNQNFAAGSSSHDIFSSIAATDSLLIIGSPDLQPDQNGQNLKAYSGAFYVFKLNGTGVWVQSQVLYNQTRSSNAYFGTGLNTNGKFICVHGKMRYYPGTRDTVVVFGLVNGQFEIVQEIEFLSQPAGYAGTQFGVASLFVEDTLFIAAPGYRNISQGANSGHGDGVIRQYIAQGDTFEFSQSIQTCNNEDSTGLAYALDYEDGVLFAGAPKSSLDENDANKIKLAGSVIVFNSCEKADLDSLSIDTLYMNAGDTAAFSIYGNLPNGTSWGVFDSDTASNPIATTQTGTFSFTPSTGGSYILRPIGPCDNECSSSIAFSIELFPLSIDEVQVSNARVFPNPVHSLLNVSADVDIMSLSLLDLSGRFVKGSVDMTSQKQAQIDLRGIPNGVYFVRLKSAVGEEYFKVVKQ